MIVLDKMDPLKTRRLLRIKRVQIEMIRDRGYLIPPEEEKLYVDTAVSSTLSTYVDTYMKAALSQGYDSIRKFLNRIYVHNKTKRTILVYYAHSPTKDKLEGEVVKGFIAEAQKHAHSILITPQVLQSKAEDNLSALDRNNYQIFLEKELTFNVTRHIIVPKHTLLNPLQNATFLKKIKATLSQLPVIKKTDPVVKYYKWPANGIVRINRYEYFLPVLVKKSVYYRRIVD